jgi:hypothetical protein
MQKTLESAVVKQRLKDFGLSTEETMARINVLSDEQLHQFAAHLDSVQAGADGAGAVIFVLFFVLMMAMILQASGSKIIIEKC